MTLMLSHGVAELPVSITDPFWQFIMWDGTGVIQAKTYIRDYLFYQFGYTDDAKKLAELTKKVSKIC